MSHDALGSCGSDPFVVWFGSWLIVAGFFGAALMLADKRRAVREARRVSERTLLAIAALGGFAGVAIAAFLFRHKIRKPGFTLPLFTVLVLWLFALWKVARFFRCV